MAMMPMTILGCGAGGTTAHSDASVHSDASAQPEAFELQGTWLYLGPADGPHTLKISNGSMAYADIDEKWSSNWSIKGYDNGPRHFQVVFESGTGTYLPVGQTMSGAYVLDGPVLTVQLANGLASYPSVQNPGSCTDGAAFIPDCRIYVSQN
jgi:hypothetical protein